MTVRIANLSTALLAIFFSATVSAASRVSTPPKMLIDLSNFKLALPVDKNGKPSGKANEIINSVLNGSPGYSSSYFYSDSNGAVVFYAPSNGATTNPASDHGHARAELRELYRVSGPTEWTNNIGGTMNASCQLNKVAKKSSKAIIGQIHGLDSAFVLVYYDIGKKAVGARFYTQPGSEARTEFVLASNIKVGDRINYQIQWIGSSASVTVNGRTVNRMLPAWNNVPVYFKAGAYSTAPSKGNAANDGTDIAFYSLQLQH